MKKREESSLKIELLMSKKNYGLTASEIALEIGLDRGRINSILYDNNQSIFQKIGSESPPRWRLSGLISPNEVKQETQSYKVSKPSKSDLITELVDDSNLLLGPPCAYCSELSTSFFCSARCRNRAIDQWRLSKILVEDSRESDSTLRFVLLNPTCQLGASRLEAIQKKCTLHSSRTQTFLDLWNEHDRDTGESIRCLKLADEYIEILPQFDHRSGIDTSAERMEIAVADLSKSYQNQILVAFKKQGLGLENTDLISQSQLEGLEGLSESIRRKVGSVVERKKNLFGAFADKKIDEFTLRFLGVSTELSDWIDIKSPMKTDLLESLLSIRSKITSTEMRDEFFDLLIALESHPFLPTWNIVENLEVWTPPQLVEESSFIRSRLIETLRTTDSKVFGKNKKQGRIIITRLLRRLQIIDGVVKGRSLEEISNQTGVSRERIRQLLIPVLAHTGVADLKSLRIKAREHSQLIVSQRDAENLRFQAQVTEFIRQHPGVSIAELNECFPGSVAEVLIATKRHQALVLRTFPIDEESEIVIRDDMVQSLKDASLLAFPLTGVSYDELLEQGLIRGVSRQRIMQVFGTWIAACEYAEVEPGSQLKGVNYVRTYSYKEMLRVVGQFLIDDDSRGYTGGLHSYGGWRSSQELADNLPSEGTIRNQVDASWKRVKELAMVELRSGWSSMNGLMSETHDG